MAALLQVGFFPITMVIVEAFKATGKGWQTRMNAALKDWLKTHSPA